MVRAEQQKKKRRGKIPAHTPLNSSRCTGSARRRRKTLPALVACSCWQSRRCCCKVSKRNVHTHRHTTYVEQQLQLQQRRSPIGPYPNSVQASSIWESSAPARAPSPPRPLQPEQTQPAMRRSGQPQAQRLQEGQQTQRRKGHRSAARRSSCTQRLPPR